MKPKQSYIFISIFLIAAFICDQAISQAAEKIGNESKENVAIIILSTVTVDEMQSSRKVLEANGVKVRNVFPPSVFIATVPRQIVDQLKELEIIEDISYVRIDQPGLFAHFDATTQDAIKLWNSWVEKKFFDKRGFGQGKAEGTIHEELKISTDLSNTEQERRQKNEEYQKKWNQKKEKLLKDGAQKKESWEKKHLKKKKKSAQTGGLILFAPGGANAQQSGSSFGEASGSGYEGTSLFMSGNIAVSVFFYPSPFWTQLEINRTFEMICGALNQFMDDEPNANISFTCIKEVDGSGVPHSLPLNERDYVNDLRNTYQTDWAYMIKVAPSVGRSSAFLWGPSVILSLFSIGSGEQVVRHETMHIFGAVDQYGGSPEQSPSRNWGYLNVVNATSEHIDGTGYFNGTGESSIDIMKWGGPIGVYSRGQVGWRDRDGDGILDPLDTVPNTVILGKTGSNPFSYFIKAVDHTGVTLNTIIKIEYRLNGGPWLKATAADGALDEAEEEAAFTLRPLRPGKYTMEIRSTNSVGNIEKSFAFDEFTVADGSTANVPPFAGFSMSPSQGSLNTSFVFDASSVYDIEDAKESLQVRWDFENDGIWDTTFLQQKTATHQYLSPGVKEVKLEVRDLNVATDSSVERVTVTSLNQPAYAFFTATPENIHNQPSAVTFQFNASGSFDAEDSVGGLGFRWDFEDDGVWDTEYSHTASIQHTYILPSTGNVSDQFSKHWKVRLELRDSSGMISQTTRDVWTVPYNHPPNIQDLEMEEITGEFPKMRLSATAQDQDIGSSWDGILSYRWDFDNDDIWDTIFSADKEAVVALKNLGSSASCEVRDRFGAVDKKSIVLPGINKHREIILNYPQTIEILQDFEISVEAKNVPEWNFRFLHPTATELPPNAVWTPNTNGVADGMLKGVVRWIPRANQVGNYLIPFEVEGVRVTANVTVQEPSAPSRPMTGQIVLQNYPQQGVPNVSVQIRRGELIVSQVSTNAAGVYETQPLLQREYLITPQSSKYAFVPAHLTINSSIPNQAHFTAVPIYPVSGYVQDQNGIGLASFDVRVCATTVEENCVMAQTNAQGYYQTNALLKGEYKVSVSKRVSDPVSYVIFPAESTIHNEGLEPVNFIAYTQYPREGRVVFEQVWTDKPLATITVEQNGRVIETLQTNAHGEFRTGPLNVGQPYTIKAKLDHFDISPSEITTNTQSTSTSPISFFATQADFSIRAYLNYNQQPASNITVLVIDRNSDAVLERLVTDQNGFFQTRYYGRDQEVKLVIEHSYLQFSSIPVFFIVIEEEVGIRHFDLNRMVYPLSGYIISNGVGIPGVTVALQKLGVTEETAVTNASGYFETVGQYTYRNYEISLSKAKTGFTTNNFSLALSVQPQQYLTNTFVDTAKPVVTSSLGTSPSAGMITLNARAIDPAPSSRIDKIVFGIRQAGFNAATNSMAYFGSLAVTKTAVGSPTDFNTSTDVARSWMGSSGIAYLVKAYDTAGNVTTSELFWYDGTTLRTPDTTAPSVVSGLTAMLMMTPQRQVVLNWHLSTDASGSVNYEVYRNGTLIGSTTVGVTTFVDKTVTQGTTHQYTVKARDVWGNKSATGMSVSISIGPGSGGNVGIGNTGI